MGKQNLFAELRWLPGLETKNRLWDYYVWLKVVHQFLAPKASARLPR